MHVSDMAQSSPAGTPRPGTAAWRARSAAPCRARAWRTSRRLRVSGRAAACPSASTMLPGCHLHSPWLISVSSSTALQSLCRQSRIDRTCSQAGRTNMNKCTMCIGKTRDTSYIYSYIRENCSFVAMQAGLPARSHTRAEAPATFASRRAETSRPRASTMALRLTLLRSPSHQSRSADSACRAAGRLVPVHPRRRGGTGHGAADGAARGHRRGVSADRARVARCIEPCFFDDALGRLATVRRRHTQLGRAVLPVRLCRIHAVGGRNVRHQCDGAALRARSSPISGSTTG